MSADPYDEILAELLEAAESGREVALEAILAKHPGHEATVRRVQGDLAKYKRLSAAAGVRRPVLVDALQHGDRLGDFEIDEPLASGGMGIVYRARQLSLGSRSVALKVLPVDSANSRDVARFQREALALAGLHHPHLSEVFGFGEERGCLFFAMRLVEGPNLRDLLESRAAERGRDDPATRRKLVARIAEVAEALAVVHAAGLVHRDIKPSNIVLEGVGPHANALDGSAVLVDFGLVRPVDTRSATVTGDSPATPSYAPPEQLIGRDIDARADVFSLGVTLHDLLAARAPHQRMQASVGLEAIENLVSGIGADLGAIVGKCVDPEASWRYANAGALLADLRAWLAGEHVSARRTLPRERVLRWAARNPRTSVLCSAGALLMCALTVYAGARYRELAGYGVLARDAQSRGDHEELYEMLSDIPAWLAWPVLRDDDLEALARSVRKGDPNDPFVATYRQHRSARASDAAGRLREVASSVRLLGLRSDASRVNYLESALTHHNERDGKAVIAERLQFAVVIVARLFYERPVLDADDDRVADGIHAALVELARRDDLDRDTRLHVFTALSGCGRPEDLVWILERTLSANQPLEEQRIGISCAERIIRRAHACGTLARIPFIEVWKRYKGVVDECIATPHDDVPFQRGNALHGLHTALLLAVRKLGRESELAPITQGPWRKSALEQLSLDGGEWYREVPVVREPRLRDKIAAELAHADASRFTAQFGRLCGVFDDSNLIASARGRMHTVGTPECCAEFDRGLANGRHEIDGIRADLDPDADTLLGAPPGEYGLIGEHRVRSEGRWEYLFGWDPKWDMHEVGNGPGQRNPVVPMKVPAAHWLFFRESWSVGGGARDATCRFGAIGTDGAGFLKLGIAGQSEVTLTCELPAPPRARVWTLVVRHQMGMREYYPFSGRTEVQISLNGTPIQRALLTRSESSPSAFELPTSHTSVGLNEIRIRLTEATTTTYRLLAAGVVLREQF